MRIAFWSVAMAIAVGGVFLSGTVLPNDREEALAPGPTIAEGPPYPQPPGWSCDGSNWIFFDRECGRRGRHKHRHHPVIAADGKDSIEARREPGSALESSPAPAKPVQIPLNGRSAAKAEAEDDARGNRREHRRASRQQTVRHGDPPGIPPVVYGYYAYAAMRREAQAGGARAHLRLQHRSFSVTASRQMNPTSVLVGHRPFRRGAAET
jgi:hypothetical protein